MSFAMRSSGGLKPRIANLSAFLRALSSAVRVLAWIACLSPSIAWIQTWAWVRMWVCVWVWVCVIECVCVSRAGPHVNPRSDFNLIQNRNKRVGVWVGVTVRACMCGCEKPSPTPNATLTVTLILSLTLIL